MSTAPFTATITAITTNGAVTADIAAPLGRTVGTITLRPDHDGFLSPWGSLHDWADTAMRDVLCSLDQEDVQDTVLDIVQAVVKAVADHAVAASQAPVVGIVAQYIKPPDVSYEPTGEVTYWAGYDDASPYRRTLYCAPVFYNPGPLSKYIAYGPHGWFSINSDAGMHTLDQVIRSVRADLKWNVEAATDRAEQAQAELDRVARSLAAAKEQLALWSAAVGGGAP